MTEQLKQRVWGMIILVVIGVVFLPDLLDGKKETTKNDFKKIPSPPVFNQQPEVIEFPTKKVDELIDGAPDLAEVKADDDYSSQAATNAEVETDEQTSDTSSEVAVAEQNTSEGNEEVDTTTSQTSSNPDNQTTASEEKVAVVEKTPVIASKPLWILQLGSFKHKENVVALREKLDKAGVKTFTKPITTKAGILSKVYVGPEQQKEKLVEVQKTLKEVTGLSGKITRYSPIN